jgi:hypothetical protein
VERAARRERDADHEYEQAVGRAARLGVAQRNIAAAGQAARGTIRVIPARSQIAVGGREAATTSGPIAEAGAEQQRALG